MQWIISATFVYSFAISSWFGIGSTLPNLIIPLSVVSFFFFLFFPLFALAIIFQVAFFSVVIGL